MEEIGTSKDELEKINWSITEKVQSSDPKHNGITRVKKIPANIKSS